MYVSMCKYISVFLCTRCMCTSPCVCVNILVYSCVRDVRVNILVYSCVRDVCVRLHVCVLIY